MNAYQYRHIPFVTPIWRGARKLVRATKYAGSAVHCVICDRSFSGWIDGDCPHCRSACRHRFLWSILATRWTDPRKPVSLLHFAPEECLQRAFKRDGRLSRYITVDLSAPNADIHADITATGLDRSSFDAIVCCHVLEHIPDDLAAMRELHRLLRPDGVAYIQVPCRQEVHETDEDPGVTDPSERERRFGQFDHVRSYGMDIIERLESAGFRVTPRRVSDVLSAEEMRAGGHWDDILFECQKPSTAGLYDE